VTEKLLDSAESDAIDALLRDLRVSSTIFCRSQLSAPWGFGVRAHGRAAFHVVTTGECWLEVEGDPDRRRLRAGDLAILTRGDTTHWLRDEQNSPTLWLEDLLAQDPVEPDGRLRSGGGGATTDLLCGAFVLEGNGHHPVLSALPTVICARGEGDRPLPWLAATLELVASEIDAPGAGAAAVLERVSEILVGQALRASLLDLQGAEDLNLGAFYDRGIAPAVRAIHEHPERTWSVGELASLCAMSRSAFAARFRALTGDSPIRYVTRCRLARAASQLRTTTAPLAGIALLAGYESVFSFSRAFKRAFGIPPRSYRTRDEERGE
jgi:AraC-like DNA-binding protein